MWIGLLELWMGFGKCEVFGKNCFYVIICRRVILAKLFFQLIAKQFQNNK